MLPTIIICSPWGGLRWWWPDSDAFVSTLILLHPSLSVPYIERWWIAVLEESGGGKVAIGEPRGGSLATEVGGGTLVG